MDLYYGKMSGNSARALFGLQEVGAPFTPRLVDPKTGGNRTPEYLSINPMGKIPALVDGDFRLWESNAINWYAAEQNPAARLLPTTAQGRAAVQRWLFFQAAHVSPACTPIFLGAHERAKAYWAVRIEPAAVEKARNELPRWLAVLDGALRGQDWLEREFSLADVAYAPHLALVDEAGFDLGAYPALRAWLDRLLARPAWRTTAELVFAKTR